VSWPALAPPHPPGLHGCECLACLRAFRAAADAAEDAKDRGRGPMRIREIRLRGFMSHAETTVTLPDRGVVLVSGGNGSGKSTFAEAVSWALWGRTIRGSVPWRGDEGCEAAVVLGDGLTVARERRKGKAYLAWQRGDAAAPTYESATRAQEALEYEIGTQDQWRRSHVFSSADAAHFSAATDAERKRLLEGLLGLAVFDPALERCREDIRAASGRVQALTRDVERAAVGAEACGRRVADASAVLARLTAGEAFPSPAVVITARQDASDARAALMRAEDARREGATQLGRARGQVSGDERALALLAADRCPTCGQAVTGLVRAPHEARLRASTAAVVDLSEADLRAASDVGELREEAGALARHAESLQSACRREQELTGLREQAERAKIAALHDQATAEAEGAAAAGELALARSAVAELAAAEQVLGFRGVRAQMLARLLDGLTTVANAWLARLCDRPITLRLAGTTERKSGAVVDAISLAVEGAGGGQGYDGASGGERRRIDVALLLALAEITPGARGTLILDEALDALDTAGVEAVVGLVEEIAQDRAVLLITHNTALAERIRPALHLLVSEGTVALG